MQSLLFRAPLPDVSGSSGGFFSGWQRSFFCAQKNTAGRAFSCLWGLSPVCWWGNACLKNLIARPRPCWLDSSVQLLIANPADYSFPSGHTLSSVIGATGLTKTNRRFGYAAIPLAALIAFSRLYLYVHFPSDVLAAAVLGVALGELVWRCGGKLLERWHAPRGRQRA